MNIELSKNLSYCCGICNAIDKTIACVNNYKGTKKIYMLGDLAHNEEVIKIVCELGVNIVHNIEDVPTDSLVIIRAHGATSATYDYMEKKGLEFIDLTCPFVKKIQNKVKQMENNGYDVVIIGNKYHDEIVIISSFLKKPYILAGSKDDMDLNVSNRKIYVVTQTTIILDEIIPVIRQIALVAKEFTFKNTICPSTEIRQKEIVDLAQRNDLVLLVGSMQSNNTKNLYRISKQINELSFLVQDNKNLPEEIGSVKSIAIASGASTPNSVIEKIRIEIEKQRR